MKRKSTAPSGRAISPSRLTPTPRTIFRMDVVVDRNFILSQEKSRKESTRGNATPSPPKRQFNRNQLDLLLSAIAQNQRAESMREIVLAQLHRYHKTNPSTRKK